MAKLSLLAGTTSKMVDVFIQDTSVTTGAGLTGLTNASSGLTWYYYREGAGAAVQVTPIASMTLGTWTTKGFIVVDGTNMPGLYQLGVPDAALAAGAKSVVMMLKGATNMAAVVIEIELTAVDNQTANLTAAQIATGVWQDTTAGDFTTSASIGKSVLNGVSLGTGLTVAEVSNITTIDKTSNAIGRGTVTTGGSTTSIPTSALTLAGSSATGVVASQFVGRIVLFDGDTTTAGLRGAASAISASTASNTPTLTVGTLPATPASTDTFSII